VQKSPVKISPLPKLTPAQGNFILAATIIGAGMVYLDGTVVTVALPRIQAEFGASVSGLQWLIDIYILFLTIPILVAGTLSDRYGHRKLYNIGLIGFTLASIGCGAATSLNQLILARIFQGISGAIMLPGSLAILNASFPPEVRGRTMGTWSAFTPITTAIGPLVGGWLVDNVSWRAAFYLNVPLAVVTLYLSLRYIPESKSEKAPPTLDWMGAGLVTIGLGSLIFGLIEGPKRGWGDPLVWLSILASLVCLVGFGLVEIRTKHPLIPISLFKHQAFSGVTIITLILYFAMSGVFFFYTLNLQQIQGFTATQAGLAFMPIILLLFLISRWAGSFADRVGPRWPMIVGQVVIAIGFFMYLIPSVEANYWLTFFPATLVFGLGLGITVAPLTTVALGAVPTHLSGLASGVSNAASRVATMLAVATLGALMVLQFGVSLEHRTRDLPLTEPDRQQLKVEALDLGGAEPPAHLATAVQAEVAVAIDRAFIDAYRLMMVLCGVLALVSAGISAATIGDKITHHQLADIPRFELEVGHNGRDTASDRSLTAVSEAREGLPS
jgi:EmrB/QacA subfamily drug resistance transporter